MFYQKYNLFYLLILFAFICTNSINKKHDDDDDGSGIVVGVKKKVIRIKMETKSLVDIEPNSDAINLSLNPPTEAGTSAISSTNTTKWLNYTSQLRLGDPDLTISVDSNLVIPGVDLLLDISSAINGGGVLGTTVGSITINTTPTVIINGIGGAYTGDGINNGHQLTYSLGTTDYSQVSSLANETIVVTYTLND